MSVAARLGRRAPDGGIVASTTVLAAIGLVTVYSATAPLAFDRAIPPHFVRHAVAMAIGAGLAALAMRVPLAAWRNLSLPLWAASVALLAATLLFGSESHGARRWIALPVGGLTFQPGELAKWATLLAAAAWLARADSKPRRPATFAPLLLLAGIPAVLLWRQPDTGSAVLLVALVGLLCFVAGAPLRLLTIPAVAGLAALVAAVATRPYAWSRLRAFWDPWALAQHEGFQLVQSFVAFGRGGAFGVGLGDGRQKLSYLPEAHTDFVLSLIAEELGVFGVALVLGAFAGLWIAGCRIAARSRDRFALLLVFAMTTLITVPAALNAAVVMGLVPPKGLALPFVSYGRTSLLMGFLAIGVVLGVARREGAPTVRKVAGAERRGTWRA